MTVFREEVGVVVVVVVVVKDGVVVVFRELVGEVEVEEEEEEEEEDTRGEAMAGEEGKVNDISGVVILYNVHIFNKSMLE